MLHQLLEVPELVMLRHVHVGSTHITWDTASQLTCLLVANCLVSSL